MKIKLAILYFLICTISRAQDKETFTGSEDNVEYKAIFDGKDVYVTLRIEFKETMQSMLHRGYTIYFDVKGKKKKNVSIHYPLNAGRSEKGSKPERGERREKDENSEQKGPDIAKMIENAPKKANYTYFDSSRDFNLDINDLGITMSYNYEDANEGPILVYHLKIPASKISEDNIDLTKLSIGIVSNKLAQNQQQPSVSMGGRQGGGQGRPSGGRGGGRGGAGRGNSGVPAQRTATTENTIDFWFKLYPKKNK
ncbi:hypothetical protein M4I21_01755 [Cellulophaga sp. 20_2_10]|uniref:hypothetical protein n=1 Tax=Cellulophaga sp. 20_2_10 TaxID=2942476 RepID=UPI00201A32ED|nr:hypothetical protein [Cellulophaga sp. 20_2_10]MCL5244513.1 hypothetical protein [Cellulophaga sp. 20_2_10]